MTRSRSVLLITSDRRRHRFAASRLGANLDLVGVVVEKKAPVVEDESALPPEDREVVERHFAERDEVEARMLGEASFPDVDRLEVERGGSNDPATFAWVRERDPEMVLLYGSSIIRPPLLDAYDGRMINLHLGLSPYYRGSGTNFWPLVNGEPECVGATLHLAVAKVDAGPILGQVRPEPKVSDRAHELGTRTLMAGLDAMTPVVDAFLEGTLEGRVQDLSRGKVYRNRDFDADAVRTMWRNFDEGMMEAFVAEREERYRQVPIVEVPERP